MLGTSLRIKAIASPRNKQCEADIIVVNTCGFIDSAKKESIDTILEMAELKTHGKLPQAGGCRLPGGALSQPDSAGDPGDRLRFRALDELGRILEAVRLDGDEPIPDASP